jgi:hypothetical protein
MKKGSGKGRQNSGASDATPGVIGPSRDPASFRIVSRVGPADTDERPKVHGRAVPARSASRPRLRLVGSSPHAYPGAVVKPNIEPTRHAPITDTADPRWVLAVRTAEALEGSLLTPEKRERLVRLGKIMGLSAFDASLVIAIVQDQARRGYAPAYCPTAGEPQLRMVPPARMRPWPMRRWLGITTTVAACLALEVAVLAWLF